jgi:predicted transposase YbfD/YdcC
MKKTPIAQLDANDLALLLNCFQPLSDPRLERCKLHKLIDIVVIGLATLISGGEGFADMEAFGEAKQAQLKEFLELKNGIPSHDTFGRVFALLNPREFEQCLGRWIKQKIQLAPGEVIPIDGKTLRGSHDQSRAQAQMASVSAWAQQQGVLLAEVKVAADSNEITAVPAVLPLLNIEGCIVTFDALNCQKTIVAQIRAQKADYVGALKGNHPQLEQAVAEFLQAVQQGRTSGIAHARHETIEKDHGRIETRQYWQAAAPDFLPEFGEWCELQSVGCVISTRTLGEKTTTETRYYLSSLAVEAPRFARAVRGHWSIENSCHWVLDVIFGEDASRVRVANAAENLGLLRRFALNLLKRVETPKKQSVRSKRLRAAWEEDFWLKVLRN